MGKIKNIEKKGDVLMRPGLALNIAIIACIAALFLFVFSSLVPFHMDAFCHYQALMCHTYPLSAFNQFRDACAGYDLAPIPGHYLPLRSFAYIGSLPSLLYYPLFTVWPSPYSARLFGLIVLAIQALLIYKIFNIEPAVSFIALLFCMPYAFQHLEDFGTIALQTTAVFLIYHLTLRWIRALQDNKNLCDCYPLFIGIILFLGIWTKLSFFALIPGIIILIVYSFIQAKLFDSGRKSNFKNVIRGMLLLLFSALIPSFVLFNSETRTHQKYYDVLSKGASMLTLTPQKGLLKFLSNPLLSAHNSFMVQDATLTVEGFLLIATVALFLILGMRKLRAQKSEYGFALIGMLLFFLTLYFIIIHPDSWAMHHVVLSFPFLILAILYVYSKLQQGFLAGVMLPIFLIVNLSLYSRLASLKPYMEGAFAIPKINSVLNEGYAQKYVFIIIDGGLYYIQALYGRKDQCVLYVRPLDTISQIEALKGILHTLHRKALFIARVNSESNLSLIKNSFPDLALLSTDFDTGQWRLWYER